MDNKVIKSKYDKLRDLGIDDDKHCLFSDICVDIIFDKFKHLCAINNVKRTRLLYFLNEILGKLGLDYVSSLGEFKLDRSMILTLDGEDFVDCHRETLLKYGLHLNNDLFYHQRNQIKNYGFTVMKAIVKFYGYTIQPKNRSVAKDDRRQNIKYYIVEQDQP